MKHHDISCSASDNIFLCLNTKGHCFFFYKQTPIHCRNQLLLPHRLRGCSWCSEILSHWIGLQLETNLQVLFCSLHSAGCHQIEGKEKSKMRLFQWKSITRIFIKYLRWLSSMVLIKIVLINHSINWVIGNLWWWNDKNKGK